MRKSILNRFLIVLMALALSAPLATALPTTGPATKPATRPATQTAIKPASRPTTQARSQAQRLTELTHRAIQLMEAGKYAKAESVLAEALAIDPKEPTDLYNMACLLALTNRQEQALDFLERSAEAGFVDFNKFAQDSDLDSLRDLPRYKAFIAKKDEYLHKAAEAIIEALRKTYGDDYLYEIDDADKLIFATNTDRPTLDALKQNLVRQAHSQWEQIFEHKPDEYICVVVPSPREFHRLIPIPGIEGIYQHEIRTLIAKGLGFVTMHEFTHALHFADVEPLGQEHPIWLVEGMAVLFEHAEYEKGPDGTEVLVPKDNERLVRLQAEARQKKLMPLSRLLKMDHKEFMDQRVMQCYAESGSIMHYLYDQKLLRKFYDTFKTTYAKDKTGRAALEATVGKPLEEFEKDWETWMLTRLPPSGKITVDSPYLGVDFGEANDGMLIQTMKTGGPAARAGLRVGDVIIAVDGEETRDQMTFGPLMTSHKPGDKVILRLRRNHAYLEVPMILGSRKDPKMGGAVGKTGAPGTGELLKPAR